MSVGGRTLNPNISYFFALIAYACLSGAFLGVKGCRDIQANLSALGARNCITPTHKMKMLVSNFLVMFGIHFVNIMILTVYVRFVLGIDLGGNPGAIILVNLMGSMIGVSMGILLGCINRVSFSMRTVSYTHLLHYSGAERKRFYKIIQSFLQVDRLIV